MLLLSANNVNICNLSKILVKHNINAQIEGQTISITGDLSDNLLTELCASTNVLSVQNFTNDSDTNANIETAAPTPPSEALQSNSLPAIKYTSVSRGQVYLCDLGQCCNREQGGVRPVIVIQNNTFNKSYDTTIVIPLTSKVKKYNLPGNFTFSFKDDIVSDCNNPLIFNAEKSVALLCQMKAIDNARLLKYLCTLTPEFMSKLTDHIDNFLALNRSTEIVNSNNSIKTTTLDYEKPNEIQQDMLKLINPHIAYSICSSNLSDSIKVESLLEIFGFDKNRRGVDILTLAILESFKFSSFNVETLSNQVAKIRNDIELAEIQRLIVARVKERFNFKKSPAIDFIRLINSLVISKGELFNE